MNLVIIMLLQKDIPHILKSAGLRSEDTILIHSGLKAIGKIEENAEGLLSELMRYFSDGLLIFPTHTWATMQNDGDIFDTEQSPSCVGTLTEIARKTPGFIRSFHPTHSVCAYGGKAQWYVDHDLTATTPVGPSNCFGILKDMNAKILFLGAPLSKNTFIHSIEEEFNVADRFTAHTYHFISQGQGIRREYHMPKHYSTLSPHISEHYEKLLPLLLKHNIAKDFPFGETIAYLVDAKGCHSLVSKILTKDIHAFDSFKNISALAE